jgi:hypothetical protein
MTDQDLYAVYSIYEEGPSGGSKGVTIADLVRELKAAKEEAAANAEKAARLDWLLGAEGRLYAAWMQWNESTGARPDRAWFARNMAKDAALRAAKEADRG